VTKGSYAHHLLVLVLERAHLSVNDVQIIHLPPADLVNAFNAGELDAAATWEPYLSRIEVGPVKRVADGTGIKQGALVIIAMEQFATQNPELIGAFLRAYQRGHTYLNEQPKEAGELIASEIKLEAEQFQKLLPNFDYGPAITAAIHQELAGTEQFLRTNGLSKGPVDIEKFVDDTYGRAAGINK
jgi:sulfonate transport system substrate-binding protein